MTTRKIEKRKRAFKEKKKLKQKINMRMLGQSVKDDGRWFHGHPNKFSPSKRERKKLDKLNKIINS